MIKKGILSICCFILLCGCSTSQSIDVTTKEAYNKAVEISTNLNNYSLMETCKITTTIKDQEKQEATTSIIVLLAKTETEKEGYAHVSFALEGVGSNEVEVWEKENMVYLSNDGTRSVNDVETVDVLSNITNNTFFKIVTHTPIISGSQRVEKGNTIIDSEVDEGVILALLETATFLDEGYTLKVKDNASEITINDNNEITQIQVSVRVDMELDETVMEAQIELKSVLQAIGSTQVQFPNDLYSFESSQVEKENDFETLKKTLVKEFDYTHTDEVYVYDWGTEKYVFDFKESVFYLETERGNYAYNWILDNGSTTHSGCLYDFQSEDQKNCSEEEIENIKLSKEVFEGELSYSGISLNSLNKTQQ